MQFRVGPRDELLAGMRFVVGEPGHPIAVFVLDDATVRAIDDACPHHGASLALAPVCRGHVVCPWHGWRISLSNGRPVGSGHTDGPDRSHAVEEDDEGVVWVSMSSVTPAESPDDRGSRPDLC